MRLFLWIIEFLTLYVGGDGIARREAGRATTKADPPLLGEG
jgi:hypothetical protein